MASLRLEISSGNHHSITIIYLHILLTIFQLSSAADTISPAEPLKDGDTLVSTLQNFELGFFSPGNLTNKFLGIWYKNITPQTTVWVANRNNPITDSSGVLTVSTDGKIVLLKQSNSVVWSSNISENAENPVAQLLDSGNFVVRSNVSNGSESYKWQSFDYPTDTQLPNMKLGWDLKSGLDRYLTSWRNKDDPSPGDLTFRIDLQGVPQLVLRNGSKKISRTGPWNGVHFGTIPLVPYMAFNSTRVISDKEIYYTYEPISSTMIMRLTLGESGETQFLVWNGQNTGWTVLYSMKFDQCENYEWCGPNGICNPSSEPDCVCFDGFVPKFQNEWTAHNWTSGCVRSTPMNCEKDEGFLKLDGVKLPDLLEYKVNQSMNLSDCETECSKNCNCTAYASSNISVGDSGCLMWFGDLVDTIIVNQEYKALDVYIKTPASKTAESSSSSSSKRSKLILAVSITIGIFFFSFICCCILRNTRTEAKATRRGQEYTNQDIELPLFDLAVIVDATNNFSQENVIGKGGFGPVYKGNLSTGEEIAVKRLSKDSGQGVEQFMNEIDLIVKLQHRNLVALLGCCIQGEERMLIYEYMPNKSLDHFIFDHRQSTLLGWQQRFNIILGIARGLLYLHQDSKLQIIHRDLKTSNILLDIDLNPKISDFGLARILEVDQMEAITKRVVGTYGYMSPEYAIDGTISIKSDVFSLGVILLEVVTGKRNRGFCDTDHNLNLLGHAWSLWNEGRVVELVDKKMKDSCITSQVMRCIQVGLLCVQNFPGDRPAMASVVFMLANEDAVLPRPKQPGFFKEGNSITDVTESSSNKETYNSVTITMLDGR